jgi:hypothetical protein
MWLTGECLHTGAHSTPIVNDLQSNVERPFLAQTVSKRVAVGNLTTHCLVGRSRLIDCGTTKVRSELNVLQGPVRPARASRPHRPHNRF